MNTYQPEFNQIIVNSKKRGAGKSMLKKAINSLSVTIAFSGILLFGGAYVPALASNVSNYIFDTASNSYSIKEVNVQKPEYIPAFDSSLPLENRLFIPSIKVDTQIWEASLENHEDALKKGVWRANDASTPENRDVPTILAAHRFGYLKWDNLYRRYNSFYNLSKMKEGDTVEIIWKQRKYIYGVYRIEEDTKINDYSADLILYTCRDLTSDIRIFVYAKLLEI